MKVGKIMKKNAVIDVGSNSVRLMLVADGKVLYKDLETTRLGEGLAYSKTLLPQAIERTAAAMARFYERAKAEGAETVRAFATAAVRSAENREAFLEKVASLCPLQVEVVSGEEEAELGLLGALGNSDGGIVDIGGASTELIVKKSGVFEYKKSVNIGVVRIKDNCTNEKELNDFCQKAIADFGQVPPLNRVYAVGGTATTLASLVLKLKEYSSEKVTGTLITQEKLYALVEDLRGMTVEEIANLPCMPKGRADVITGGAVWLYTLMQALSIREICVSDRDNLEGYALKKGLTV